MNITMKVIYYIILFFIPYLLFASKNTCIDFEKYLYDKTSGYFCNGDIQTRIENLKQIGLLEKFLEIYKRLNWDNNTIINFIKIGSIENPSISIYSVSDNEIAGIKVYFDGQSNAIAHKTIIQTISKSKKEEIANKISGLKKCFTNPIKSKLKLNENDPVIIFNFRDIEDSVVVAPKTLFPDDNESIINKLISLRSNILLELGLDSVEADLNTAPVNSLQNRLRNKSILNFKDINSALNCFLRNNKIYGIGQSLWQYYTSSNNPLDKYLSVWIYNIDMRLNQNMELPVEYLFNENFLPYIDQLDPNENILYTFIYYKYSQFKGNKKLSEFYLDRLRKEDIDKRLL